MTDEALLDDDKENGESTPSTVLLMEGPDRPWDELTERIARMGLVPVRTASVAEAEAAVAHAPEPIRAALLPAEFADRRLKGALGKLGETAGGPLGWIAVGEAPDRTARKHLRAAGVTLALWQPFDDETLRFQLNRALTSAQGERVRGDARIPSRIPCRLHVGDRTKDGELYNLSAGGAFVKTPRASMNGAKLRVSMRIERRDVTFPAEVIFANVVGNLQKPNLPLGMGIGFYDVPDEDLKALRDHVANHLAQLEV